MKLSYMTFILRRALKSFTAPPRPHGATAVTAATMLSVLGGFFLILENLDAQLEEWGARVQVIAYLEDRLSAAEVEPLTRRLRGYAEIQSVRFVSQSEAWDSFKKALGAQSGVLEGLSAEALPASLEIAIRPGHRDPGSLAALAHRLSEEKGIRDVEYPKEWMENFTRAVAALVSAKWIFGGVLVLAALLIVGNTAKVAILERRAEIEVMQLLGAPPALVRTPLLLESLLYALLGAALAIALLALLVFIAKSQLPRTGFFIDPAQLRFLEPQTASLLVFVGLGSGIFGGMAALGRFPQKS